MTEGIKEIKILEKEGKNPKWTEEQRKLFNLWAKCLRNSFNYYDWK